MCMKIQDFVTKVYLGKGQQIGHYTFLSISEPVTLVSHNKGNVMQFPIIFIPTTKVRWPSETWRVSKED